jgi:hypothetical protein
MMWVHDLLTFVVMTLMLLVLGPPPTTGVLAFSLTAQKGGDPPTYYSFHNKQLQGALEIYHEAQGLANEGKHKEACDSYMTAIFWGRSTVQQLQPSSENSNNNNNTVEEKDLDDPKVALDWLVSSYRECCHCHMALEDWATARADAWAACSYSQNANLPALESMWQICQMTEDLLGEFQTLILIRPVLQQQQQQKRIGSSAASALSPSSSLSLETIEERIQAVTEQLEQKFQS